MVTFVLFMIAITMVAILEPAITSRIIVKCLSRVKKFIFLSYFEILNSSVEWSKLYSTNTDRESCRIIFMRDYRITEYFRRMNIASRLVESYCDGDIDKFIVKLFGDNYSFDKGLTKFDMMVKSISLYCKYIRCLRGRDERFNDGILLARERVIIELEERHNILSEPSEAFTRILSDEDIFNKVEG